MATISETLLGLREAAQTLQLSQSRLRQLIDGEQLPATKVGNSWIIRESDLLAFADQQRGYGRPRLYELIIGSQEAHIGTRGGALIGMCGYAAGAAFVHPMGSTAAVGMKLCDACREMAPRYVVRYWLQRGAW
jgi:excisionase family DNA binding protein